MRISTVFTYLFIKIVSTQVLCNLLFLEMYVVNYMKFKCCCPSWGVEICMQPDLEHSEPNLCFANCISSCHRFIIFSSWVPMYLKYADIKMYVLEITLNALGMAQTTTQSWNHAKSHEARWWAWYWSTQELSPFSLIFGLLFDFISPFFIATSHLYIAPLHRSSTSHSYVALYRTNVTSHPKSCLAPWHRHRLVSLHMTCQVLGPSRATRSATP